MILKVLFTVRQNNRTYIANNNTQNILNIWLVNHDHIYNLQLKRYNLLNILLLFIIPKIIIRKYYLKLTSL